MPFVERYSSEVVKFDFFFSIQTFRNVNSCDVKIIIFFAAGHLKAPRDICKIYSVLLLFRNILTI